VAKRRREQAPQAQQVDQSYYQQPAAQQQETVEPTQEALSWYENNKWYGDQEDPGNLEATQFAFFQHNMLINEGYEPDSEDYYGELNNRIYKVYPHLQSASEGDGQKDSRPSVQRVVNKHVVKRTA
jgi:hypothetical protein